MEEIIFKKSENTKRFNYFLEKYTDRLNETQYSLIKIIIINYKRYVQNEENIIFALIYGIHFFLKISKDEKNINDREKKLIKEFLSSFKNETDGKIKEYIKGLYELENDHFMLKIIIRYTIISFDEKYISIIKNKDDYFKMIGYILPLLTLKNIGYLSFFQDKYFENVYTKDYKKTKKFYLSEINKISIPGEHMVTVVNNLNMLMREEGIIGRLEVRKKSYFSLYNKIQRKSKFSVIDNIGARLVFNKKSELYRFCKVFESRYIFLQKKDFILSPKSNGYQSIHYSFLSPYRNLEVLSEIQIRTVEMDNQINSSEDLSHYNYTIKKKKWSKKFKEIEIGADILSEIIDKK